MYNTGTNAETTWGGSMPAPPLALAVHHIRFMVRAETPILFHEYAGSALRGALAAALRTMQCPEAGRTGQDPLHASLCPVCRLIAAGQGEETAGDLRRPYGLRLPAAPPNEVAPGSGFSFDLALYGAAAAGIEDALRGLLLAVRDMGRLGVGRRGEDGRRGRLAIAEIAAVHPLSGARRTLYAEGGRTIDLHTLPITAADVDEAAAALREQVAAAGGRLAVHFETPTRLTEGHSLVRTPAFFPLAKQATLRILDLAAQHGGGRPEFALKRDLYPHADMVQLAEDQTRWWDLHGHSSRLGRPQPLGGFVGRAVYAAPAWSALLPWLVWGSVAGVGKNIVKGCGWYSLAAAPE